MLGTWGPTGSLEILRYSSLKGGVQPELMLNMREILEENLPIDISLKLERLARFASVTTPSHELRDMSK